jgi:hypothetical protein
MEKINKRKRVKKSKRLAGNLENKIEEIDTEDFYIPENEDCFLHCLY